MNNINPTVVSSLDYFNFRIEISLLFLETDDDSLRRIERCIHKNQIFISQRILQKVETNPQKRISFLFSPFSSEKKRSPPINLSRLVKIPK